MKRAKAAWLFICGLILMLTALPALAGEMTHPKRSRPIKFVATDGPGVNEKTRRRIFEPFFTTKPPGLGASLGLSVPYFIVTEYHKGIIAVESLPEEGSRFIIRLPLNRV